MKRAAFVCAWCMGLTAWCGQSIQFPSGQNAFNNSVAAQAASTPWFIEFYIHDWSDSATSNTWVLHPPALGLAGYLVPGGNGSQFLIIYSQSETQGSAFCNIQVGISANLPAQGVYVRYQHVPATTSDECEMWDVNGNRFAVGQATYTSPGANSPGISVGGTAGYGMAFMRVCTGANLALGSRVPTTAGGCAAGTTLLEWKFDGDLSDSSGNGYTATLTGGFPTYVPTPNQNVMAVIKTAGAPSWSNWVSMRAGFPAQLDGTASYSQADTSNAVTCSWQVVSSPAPVAWTGQSSCAPTLNGVTFGDYGVQLVVADATGKQAITTQHVGAVATDDNGVVINANPVVDQIFGPMIAYGRNPWGYEDYLAMKASSSRYNDYLSYGLSPTWPYASWEVPLGGTVSYIWNGVGVSYAGAKGTTITSNIGPSGIAPFSVADVTKLDLSELPTRVYVSTGSGWEEIRICSVSGSTLTPCYDGRGWSDGSRLTAQAWSSGASIGQFKVTGSGTSFLTTLCPSGAGSQVGNVAYSAGTIALTPGSTAGVGADTAWTPSMAGDYVRVAGTHAGVPFAFVAIVSSVADATHLTLSRAYPADADAGPALAYALIYGLGNGTQSLWPVLHYTRTDGSDAMTSWTPFGCESDTSLYLLPTWDIPAYDAQTFSGVGYTSMTGNWWLSFGATGGLDFYGEDLAHRALYYRSGYGLALTAANMIGDMWVRMPQIDGRLVYAPLFSGGLVVGGIADAMLSTTAHKTLWTDIRGFASDGVGIVGQPCYIGDSRDTGYPLAWLALAALYDPDTTSTGAPGSIPWQTYWRNQLPAMYTRELGCAGSDHSWASGFYWNSYGDQISLTNGSAIGTGTNISANTCAGTATGSGNATNGSGVITGIGFTNGTRIAITGTKSGRPFPMWQYYTLNSSSQITLNQGAAWQGDTGPVTWMVDSTSYFLTFMQSNADTMGKEDWSCTRNSASQITLNRPWDGPSGTYGAYVGNVAGFAQQPYMLGIRQAAWRWASLAASAMGNSTLAANFNSLRFAAANWVRTTGFDSTVTNGMFYGRVQAGCEPITPASMGYGGGGPCFDDDPSNSAYDMVAMRELTAESSASLWSYYDSAAADRVSWGDLAYGSLWGYAPDTAAGYYAPGDQNTEQNPSFGASYGLDNGKWTGFFFGMGMTHEWPALRLGGVSPAVNRTLTMSFNLSSVPNATSFVAVVTLPDGAQSTYACSLSPCSITADARQGSPIIQWRYVGAGGVILAQSDPGSFAVR